LVLFAFLIADGNVDHKDVLGFVQIAVRRTIVGMFAAVGPARRGLRISPMEALGQD
jgi:hypothetical protein